MKYTCLLLSLFLFPINLYANSIEAVNLLKIFSLNKNIDYNIYDWSTGSEEGSPIEWLHSGIKSTSDNDSYSFYRLGKVDVTNHGKITHRILGKKVVNGSWDIRLTGVRGGYSHVEISPNATTYDLPSFEINQKYILESRSCEDSASYSVKYELLKFKNKKKFWLKSSFSSGSAGGATFYTIIYDESPLCQALEEDANKQSTKKNFEDLIKEGDHYNDMNNYSKAIISYKNAYNLHKTKRQKIISLSSLIASSNKNNDKKNMRLYIDELFEISPENKWLNKYIHDNDLSFNDQVINFTSDFSPTMEVNTKIEVQSKKNLKPKKISWIEMTVLIISFVFLCFILSRFKITRWLGFIEIPLILLLASYFYNMKIGFNLFIIIGIGILAFMAFSGGYEHETKAGQKDGRYKENDYNSTFSDSLTSFAWSGLLGSLLLCSLIYFKKIDPYLWGMIG